MIPMSELEALFWARVHKPDNWDDPKTCWTWAGYKCGKYGQIKRYRKYHWAHRLGYEIQNGPIPPGLLVCHTCDNPPCVRGSHLFVGTHGDNNRDAIKKGRAQRVWSGKNIGENSGAAKLTAEQVSEIRRLHKPHSREFSYPRLAAMFGVSQQTVALIIRRKHWKHLP